MTDYSNLHEDFPEQDLFTRFGKTLVRCSAMMAPDDNENACPNMVAITELREDNANVAECKAELKAAGWAEETFSHTHFGPGIPYDPIIYAQCPIHKDVCEAQLWATDLIKERV